MKKILTSFFAIILVQSACLAVLPMDANLDPNSETPTNLGAMPAAKTITVSGTIKGSDEPLPGASVTYAKNKSIGTSADNDGKFTLNNVPVGTDLEFTFVTYKAKIVPATPDMGDIVLESDNMLDEIVVTGTAKIGIPCDKDWITKIPNAVSGKTARDTNNKLICKIEECAPNFDVSADKTTCVAQVIKKEAAPVVKRDPISTSTTINGCYTKKDFKDNKWGGLRTLIRDDLKTKDVDNFEMANGGYDPAYTGDPIFDENEHASRIVLTHATTGDVFTYDIKCDIPKLSEEDSNKKIKALQDNADAMKAKERSAINRTVAAAAIAGGALGTSRAMQGAAEQKAFGAADLHMNRRTASISCEFGSGQRFAFNDRGIELPGANAITLMAQDYKLKADALKITKAELGLLPGIESEPILDKSTTGLYDDKNIGYNSAFDSRYQAALAPGGVDATNLDAQKADIAGNIKSGTTIALASVGGAMVANTLLETTGKNGKNLFGMVVPHESSAGINADYEKLKKLSDAAEKVEKAVISSPVKPGEKSGEETDDLISKNLALAKDKCNGEWIAGTCDCDTASTVGDRYLDDDFICKCTFGGTYPNCTTGTTDVAEAQQQADDTRKKAETETPKDAQGIINKELCAIFPDNCANGTITLAGVNFDFNKSNLKAEGIETIQKAAKAIQSIQENETIKTNNIQIFVNITGHTDSIGSEAVNNKLSQARATTVQQELAKNGITIDITSAFGLGKKKPAVDNTSAANRAKNRRVEIQILAEKPKPQQTIVDTIKNATTGSKTSATTKNTKSTAAAFKPAEIKVPELNIKTTLDPKLGTGKNPLSSFGVNTAL